MGKGDFASRAALALLFLLNPEISFAQQQITSFPMQKITLPPMMFAPALTSDAITAGHKCLAAYSPPPGLNSTVVSMKVAVDGSVKNITVAQTSGSDVFDQAALNCVATSLQFHPALQNGQPIEANMKFEIKWEFVPQHAGPEHPCVMETSFLPTIWETFSGNVYVDLSFTIATDGSVKNVVVTRPSGSSRIDYDATNCVSAWHFQPVMKDGQPIEYAWRTRIPVRPGRR